MDIYTSFPGESFYLDKAKQGYVMPLSDKDTNEDSDEEKTHYWESQGPLEPALREIKHPGNKKLKNELCRNFIRNGTCHYGFKCQFAHGIDELRKNENQNSKYKTKRCLSYFNEGVCMYGVRCNFLHHKK